MKQHIVATLAAIFVPTAIMVGWYVYGQFQIFPADDPYIWVRSRKYLLLCLMISAGFVVLLGLPVYLLVRAISGVRWWSASVAGFVLGALPIAIFAWPLKYSEMQTNSTMNGVQMIVDGVPTFEGWLQYLYSFSFFGALGALSGFVFWFVVQNGAQQIAAADT